MIEITSRETGLKINEHITCPICGEEMYSTRGFHEAISKLIPLSDTPEDLLVEWYDGYMEYICLKCKTQVKIPVIMKRKTIITKEKT